jgi:hypothetical protein
MLGCRLRLEKFYFATASSLVELVYRLRKRQYLPYFQHHIIEVDMDDFMSASNINAGLDAI